MNTTHNGIMSARKRRLSDDQEASSGESDVPRWKQRTDDKVAMVFCPHYTKPSSDLPADGVILESADGVYFYSELGVLAEQSDFFKDIQALGSVSTMTDSAEQSGTENHRHK